MTFNLNRRRVNRLKYVKYLTLKDILHNCKVLFANLRFTVPSTVPLQFKDKAKNPDSFKI